jgi:hypothetical protein
MLYYNITFSVETESENDYLVYQKTIFLPSIIATKLTQNHKLMRLLTEIDNGGVTYSLQLGFQDMEDYMSFEMTYLPNIITQFHHQFSGKYVSFNTLLEEV